MSEVINLGKARKAQEKLKKEKNAEANRAKFGQTKAEKQKEKLLKEKAEKLLKGHKIEDDGDNK